MEEPQPSTSSAPDNVNFALPIPGSNDEFVQKRRRPRKEPKQSRLQPKKIKGTRKRHDKIVGSWSEKTQAYVRIITGGKSNPWSLAEKKNLLLGLKNHSHQDWDSLCRLLPRRTKEEIQQRIHQIRGGETSKEKGVEQAQLNWLPIESWLDMSQEMVHYEQTDLSGVLSRVFSVIGNFSTFPQVTNPSLQPDYSKLYRYIAGILDESLTLPELTPLEACIMVDLMHGLGDQLRLSDTTLQRKVMCWKYKMLNYRFDLGDISASVDRIRKALTNDFSDLQKGTKRQTAVVSNFDSGANVARNTELAADTVSASEATSESEPKPPPPKRRGRPPANQKAAYSQKGLEKPRLYTINPFCIPIRLLKFKPLFGNSARDDSFQYQGVESTARSARRVWANTAVQRSLEDIQSASSQLIQNYHIGQVAGLVAQKVSKKRKPSSKNATGNAPSNVTKKPDTSKDSTSSVPTSSSSTTLGTSVQPFRLHRTTRRRVSPSLSLPRLIAPSSPHIIISATGVSLPGAQSHFSLLAGPASGISSLVRPVSMPTSGRTLAKKNSTSDFNPPIFPASHMGPAVGSSASGISPPIRFSTASILPPVGPISNFRPSGPEEELPQLEAPPGSTIRTSKTNNLALQQAAPPSFSSSSSSSSLAVPTSAAQGGGAQKGVKPMRAYRCLKLPDGKMALVPLSMSKESALTAAAALSGSSSSAATLAAFDDSVRPSVQPQVTPPFPNPRGRKEESGQSLVQSSSPLLSPFRAPVVGSAVSSGTDELGPLTEKPNYITPSKAPKRQSPGGRNKAMSAQVKRSRVMSNDGRSTHSLDNPATGADGQFSQPAVLHGVVVGRENKGHLRNRNVSEAEALTSMNKSLTMTRDVEKSVGPSDVEPQFMVVHEIIPKSRKYKKKITLPPPREESFDEFEVSDDQWSFSGFAEDKMAPSLPSDLSDNQHATPALQRKRKPSIIEVIVAPKKTCNKKSRVHIQDTSGGTSGARMDDQTSSEVILPSRRSVSTVRQPVKELNQAQTRTIQKPLVEMDTPMSPAAPKPSQCQAQVQTKISMPKPTKVQPRPVSPKSGSSSFKPSSEINDESCPASVSPSQMREISPESTLQPRGKYLSNFEEESSSRQAVVVRRFTTCRAKVADWSVRQEDLNGEEAEIMLASYSDADQFSNSESVSPVVHYQPQQRSYTCPDPDKTFQPYGSLRHKTMVSAPIPEKSPHGISTHRTLQSARSPTVCETSLLGIPTHKTLHTAKGPPVPKRRAHGIPKPVDSPLHTLPKSKKTAHKVPQPATFTIGMPVSMIRSTESQVSARMPQRQASTLYSSSLLGQQQTEDGTKTAQAKAGIFTQVKQSIGDGDKITTPAVKIPSRSSAPVTPSAVMGSKSAQHLSKVPTSVPASQSTVSSSASLSSAAPSPTTSQPAGTLDCHKTPDFASAELRTTHIRTKTTHSNIGTLQADLKMQHSANTDVQTPQGSTVTQGADKPIPAPSTPGQKASFKTILAQVASPQVGSNRTALARPAASNKTGDSKRGDYSTSAASTASDDSDPQTTSSSHSPSPSKQLRIAKNFLTKKVPVKPPSGKQKTVKTATTSSYSGVVAAYTDAVSSSQTQHNPTASPVSMTSPVKKTTVNEIVKKQIVKKLAVRKMALAPPSKSTSALPPTSTSSAPDSISTSSTPQSQTTSATQQTSMASTPPVASTSAVASPKEKMRRVSRYLNAPSSAALASTSSMTNTTSTPDSSSTAGTSSKAAIINKRKERQRYLDSLDISKVDVEYVSLDDGRKRSLMIAKRSEEIEKYKAMKSEKLRLKDDEVSLVIL